MSNQLLVSSVGPFQLGADGVHGVSGQRHQEGGRVRVVHHGYIGPHLVEIILQSGHVFRVGERAAQLHVFVDPVDAWENND